MSESSNKKYTYGSADWITVSDGAPNPKVPSEFSEIDATAGILRPDHIVEKGANRVVFFSVVNMYPEPWREDDAVERFLRRAIRAVAEEDGNFDAVLGGREFEEYEALCVMDGAPINLRWEVPSPTSYETEQYAMEEE